MGKTGWTNGERYGGAMKITCPHEAKEYFEKLVQYHMENKPERTREEVEEIERANIGYWTGYCDEETAKRVFELFDCTHPVFGKTRPSPSEAFGMGARMAAGEDPRA